MTEMPVRLGVVTVTYNSSSVLPDFIRSLSTQNCARFKVYAVDNASSDDSAAVMCAVATDRFDVVLIRNQENLGVAEGNNQGICRAREDGCTHVLLLNNDTVFSPELFSTMLRCAQSGGHEVIVPKIFRHSDGGRIIWYAGGYFNRKLGHSATHVGEGCADCAAFNIAKYVEYSPTCCMLVTMDVFRRVGMMDERYFVYYDDADFCLRLMREGTGIWYEPSATLQHKVGSLTGGATTPFSARMGARNKIYYLRKHFSPLQANLFTAAYFCYLFTRWVGRKDSGPLFRIKLNALREGLHLAERSRPWS
jgi:GT2 family glycosyltransferase